jgi:nicotinate-nucleotide adenylyltransferase
MGVAGEARRIPVAGRPGALRLGFHLEHGMRVGLFGGSFNPAHGGHAHVAEIARRRLGLDRVIWLVSPQNPLKAAYQTPLSDRLDSARRFASGPSMLVSDAETRIGSQYTLDTLRVLKARFPGVRFVWIMGADNLGGFHRWRGWAQILRSVPVAVIARPGSTLDGRSGPVALRFGHARRPARQANALAQTTAPAWTYLTAPLDFTSSTALRARLAGKPQTRG